MSLTPTTGYRDEWLFKRPVIRTELKNDSFVIPTFGNTCGRRQASLQISGYNLVPLITAVAAPLHTSFAMSIDMKIGNQAFDDLNADIGIFTKYVNSNLTGELDVQLGYKNNIIIYIQGTSGGGAAKIDTGVIIPPYQWVNLVVNRGFASGASTLEIWLNGVLTYSQTGIATGIDTDAAFNVSFQDRGGQQLAGKFANFKMWFPQLSQNYIKSFYRVISSKTNEITPSTVWLNYPMNLSSMTDAAGHGTALVLDGITQTISTDDYPPVGYGGSFIATNFAFNLPAPFSFIFPIIPPANPDHALAVSWTDMAGTFQRRWMYHANNLGQTETVKPVYADYNGEPIISPFTLEAWNIDGRNKVNLATPITVRLSTNTQPTLGTDRTAAVVATPAVNQVLAVQFPSTDPLTVTLKQIYQS